MNDRHIPGGEMEVIINTLYRGRREEPLRKLKNKKDYKGIKGLPIGFAANNFQEFKHLLFVGHIRPVFSLHKHIRIHTS